MSTEEFKARAADQGVIAISPDEWSVAMNLDIVREQRARAAVTADGDSPLDQHAAQIAGRLAADLEVDPNDIVTVLLMAGSYLSTVAYKHRLSPVLANLIAAAADDIERAQHQRADTVPGPDASTTCGQCGQDWPCSISQGGR